MVEPAIHHIAHRLMHRQHLPTCIAVRAGRRDGVAVVAGAALRKDGPDSVVGAGGASGRRAEIGMVYPALRIVSGPPPRHAAQGWRLGRAGRTEIRPQVRDRLNGMAERESVGWGKSV